jgi:hypothetical protein
MNEHVVIKSLRWPVSEEGCIHVSQLVAVIIRIYKRFLNLKSTLQRDLIWSIGPNPDIEAEPLFFFLHCVVDLFNERRSVEELSDRRHTPRVPGDPLEADADTEAKLAGRGPDPSAPWHEVEVIVPHLEGPHGESSIPGGGGPKT